MSQSPTSYEPYTPGRPGGETPWRPSDAIERAQEHPSPVAHVRSKSCGAPDGLVIASVVCVAIWAMSGFGYFWPIWVILPTVLPTLMARGFPRPLRGRTRGNRLVQ
jgi:hypothetical protein